VGEGAAGQMSSPITPPPNIRIPVVVDEDCERSKEALLIRRMHVMDAWVKEADEAVLVAEQEYKFLRSSNANDSEVFDAFYKYCESEAELKLAITAQKKAREEVIKIRGWWNFW